MGPLSNEESNVKFLLTLNMPSASGLLVHQVIIESAQIKSCQDLCKLMNEQEFICVKQWYRRRDYNGEVSWQDRGDMVLNTAHIGKLQEFYETEDNRNEEPYRNYDSGRPYAEVARGAVRKRGDFFR